MTAPGGGSWAEAEVGVVLNWDNVEGELRARLERESEAAAKVVRQNFAKMAVQVRKSFEAVQRGFADQMRQIERDADKTGKAIATTWSKHMAQMMTSAEVASKRIRSSLRQIPNHIAVLVDVQQTGLDPKNIRSLTNSLRRLQQIGNVNAVANVSLTGTSAEDLRAVATALRRLNKVGNNMHIVIDVTVNGIAQVERLSLLLRSLPRRTSTTVDVNTNSAAKAAKSIAGLGASFLGAIGTVGKWTAIAGAATVAVAGMLPAVAALGAALGSTLVAGAGAGIAAIGALALAGATIKTAFSGVGDALKNAFDPENAEKFNEALQKLSPQARTAVLAIQKLGTEFKRVVQQPVQDSFFANLGPQIARLQQFLVPLRDAMMTVADGFNEGAISALGFINSAQGVGMIGTLLDNSSNMAANFGSALGNLVPGLLAIGTGASQVFGPMTDGIGGAARELSNFLVEAQQSGRMAEFFQNAVNVAKQLGAVLGQLGGVISGVFRAAAAAGDGNFLGSLMTSLTSINEWVNGPGASALTSFFQSTAAAMGTVLPILLQLAGIIGGQVAPAIAGLITQIGPGISELVSGLGLGIAQLAPAMQPLGAAITSIAAALTPVMPILGKLIASVVQFAGPILGALASALSPVLQALGTGLIAAMQALMPAVQPIADLFAALSPILTQVALILGQTLSGALAVLVPVFVALANAVTFILPAIQGLVQMLTPLAPVIGAVAAAVLVAVGAFKLIQGVIAIIKAVQVAWTLLNLAFAISPIGAIVVAIAALAAGLALFFTKTETGRKIWDAIWNGIKATFTAVWNVIKGVWDAVWPVLQSGLQKIGDVVGWVAEHWKVFAAILTGPIGIIIGLAAKFGILQAAIRAIGAVFTWLWQSIIVPAFNGIKAVFDLWWAGVQVYFNLLKAALQAVGAAVMWFWNTVIAPAFSAIGAIISAWWGVVSGVFNFFIGLIAQIGSTVAGWVASVIGFFTNLASTVWATVSGWISNMWGAVSGFVTNVSTTVSGWVTNIIGFFTNLASSVGTTVSDMWNKAVQFFSDGISKAVSLVTGLKDKVVNALKGAGSWLIDTGKNIVNGLISGIKSMLSAIGNAIVDIFPGPIKRFVRSTLGLAEGGLVEGYAKGGPVGQNIRKFATGGPVYGAGTATSDSIPALLSDGEFVEPAKAVNPRTLPLLNAIRGGWQPPKGLIGALDKGIPAFAEGGKVSASDLVNFAKGVEGKPYVWGGTNWGDCSGAVSALANYATGRPPFTSRFATGSEQQALADRGFKSGLGPSGSLNIGWFNGGPYGGHTAATLPDGTHFEMGGARGDGQFGGKAVGADDAQFTDHAHLPPEFFTGLDAGSKTTGTPGLGNGGGLGGGTPIGSGLGGSSGGGSSWGNSGGGSKFNSAAEAKRGGITPVWVENWPASIGGGGSTTNGAGDLGGSVTPDAGLTGNTTPSATTTKDLKKGASKQDMVDAVYRIGKQKGMSDEQILAATETLLAESDGKNYANSNVAGSTARPHDAVGSDGKSLGVMQQQSGMGWGSDDQLMDPEYAIGKFYDRMKEQGTKGGDAHTMAQAVQRSAFADGSNYAAKRDEASKLLAAAKNNQGVPVTSKGTVPVTVTNGTDTTTTSTTTTPSPSTTTTPTTTTTTPSRTTTKPTSSSMPYGIPRANAWLGEQDLPGQLQQVGIDAFKGEVGALLEPVGADELVKKGIDELITYLKSNAQQAPQTVKYADTVNNYGMDPNKTKDKTVEGMTAVTETYRQG